MSEIDKSLKIERIAEAFQAIKEGRLSEGSDLRQQGGPGRRFGDISDLTLFQAFLQESAGREPTIVDYRETLASVLLTHENAHRSIKLVSRKNPVEEGKLVSVLDALESPDSALSKNLGEERVRVLQWFHNRLLDADRVVQNIDRFFGELKARTRIVGSEKLAVMLDAWAEDIRITPCEALSVACSSILFFEKFPLGFPGYHADVVTTKKRNSGNESSTESDTESKVQELSRWEQRRFELEYVRGSPLQRAPINVTPLDLFLFLDGLKSYWEGALHAIQSEERFRARPGGQGSVSIDLGESGWRILCRPAAYSSNGKRAQARIALMPPVSPYDPEGQSLTLRLDYDRYGVTFDFGRADFDAAYSIAIEGFKQTSQLPPALRLGGKPKDGWGAVFTEDTLSQGFYPTGVLNGGISKGVGVSRRLSLIFAALTEKGLLAGTRTGTGVGHHVRGEVHKLNFDEVDFRDAAAHLIDALVVRKPKH